MTISVDEQLIKRARVRAIEQGTSLSAKVREFLQEYVNESQHGLAKQRAEATARLMAAMDVATSKTPSAPKYLAATPRPQRTLREELYAADFRARDRKTTKAGRSGKASPVR